MLDARELCVSEVREQKGQCGGASHERHSYRKSVNVLLPEHIDTVVAAVDGRVDHEFVAMVDVDTLAANDWMLNVNRYQTRASEPIDARELKDICADINRVNRERAIVKITCNETLAKQIGLRDLYEAIANCPGDENLQRTFSAIGCEYVARPKYLQLSKNKNELRIENTDKEMLSSLFSIFLPMWRQHVFYLNDEENRLLAELRDVLLPKLMSGQIV